MATPRHFGAYFGSPWPSGICDEGVQVGTPIGEKCALCSEPIGAKDQGSFMGVMDNDYSATLAPVHKECSLRSVLGGIGHHENHEYWCNKIGDTDGGRTYRESALEVWTRQTGQIMPS